MKSESTWLSDIAIPPAKPPLVGNITAEVVIIGGGLAGSMTAYLLAKSGKKVVLLEKKDITNSITAYTTAWLNSVIDTDLSDLVKMYKEDGAKKIWQSGMEAIDLVEQIISDENIECDFKRVSHFRYAGTNREARNLEEENKIAGSLGFQTVFHDKGALPFDNLGSLELGSQAKFHPIKFLIGLRAAIEKYGGIIYENTEALSIQGEETVAVLTGSGRVHANYCVIATYKAFNKPWELFAHTGMYLSYVLEASIPHGIFAEGLYEDEKNPYHYFRIDAGAENDLIMLGGEDHRKEVPIKAEKNFRALEVYLTKLIPNVKYNILRSWRGQILETIDGLPYIGSYSKKYPNRLVATGFSGNGMTYSVISGQIISDTVLGKENPYKNLYLASRKTRPYNSLKKARDFIGEFFGGAVKNLFG